MNKRIAICIPSYKNRYSNLLSNLVNIAKDTTIDNINSITFDEILNYKETEYLETLKAVQNENN